MYVSALATFVPLGVLLLNLASLKFYEPISLVTSFRLYEQTCCMSLSMNVFSGLCLTPP